MIVCREVEFHVPLELITPKGLGSLFASGEAHERCVYSGD